MDPIVATAGYYPMVEVGLVLDETAYTDIFDKPLLNVAVEGKAIKVIFSRQTDTQHIDRCFKERATFEEDMADMREK